MKKLRLFITHILLAIMLVSIIPVPAFAEETMQETEIQITVGEDYMYVNHEKVELTAPAYIDDDVMLPFVDIAKTLVPSDNIMATDASVMVLIGQRIISLDKQNPNIVLVNGSAIPITAEWKDGTVFLDIYSTGAPFGCTDIEWDEESETAHLTFEGYLAWHKHDWADDWSYNDAHHWKECEDASCSITDIEETEYYDEHDFETVNTTVSPASLITYSCICGKSYTEEKTDMPPTADEWNNVISISIGEDVMYVNGTEKELSSPAFINENNYALFPLQDIAKVFIRSGNIIDDGNVVTILWGQKIITLSRNTEKSINVNGSLMTLQQPLIWKNDVAFFTLHDTAKILGIDTDVLDFIWYADSQTAFLQPPWVLSEHEHTWSNDWNSSSTHHWKECIQTTSPCTITDIEDTKYYGKHAFDTLITIIEPCENEVGFAIYSCICGETNTVEYNNSPPTDEWNNIISISIGEDIMHVNCTEKKLSVPAFINENGYALFPLQDIAKVFINSGNIIDDGNVVTILWGQKIITLSRNTEKSINVNGSLMTLQQPLIWKNDVAFFTLHDTAKILGIDTDVLDFIWFADSQTAFLQPPWVLSEHEHDWADEWNYDNTHHWHECTETEPPCTITDDEEKDDYDTHYFNRISITASPASLITYSCRCGKCNSAEYTDTSSAPEDWETTITITRGEDVLYVNGEERALSDRAYMNNAGYMMLPVVDIAKAMGINPNNIIFDERNESCTILWGQRIITLEKDNDIAYVNGSAIPLYPPIVWKGDAFFLSMENTIVVLGLSGYLWNGITETATLYYGEHTHTWTWNHDDSSHWKVCRICTETDSSTKGTHTPSTEVITPPTCTEKGHTTYSCICGYSYDDYTDTVDHSFIEGICTSCKKQGGENSAVTWISDPDSGEVTIRAKESLYTIIASYTDGKMLEMDTVQLSAGKEATLSLENWGQIVKLFAVSSNHAPLCPEEEL